MSTTSGRVSQRLIGVFCLVLGVACGSHDPPTDSLRTHDFQFPRSSLVAHALGGVGGKNYSNSLEALESTLARGGRFLEVDLTFTADGDLVCFHNNHEKHLGEETSVTEMTTSEFLNHRYAGRFTLIDFETLVRKLTDHPDTYIVTDCKHDFVRCMEAVLSVAGAVESSFVGRIIPQFYKADQWRDVARMETEHGSFATVIFTLYRTQIDDDMVVQLARERKVPVVTMSRKRFNTDLVARLSDIGVDSLVHTVNKPAQMIGFVDQGVRGLYSDRFVVWDEVPTVAPPVTGPPAGSPMPSGSPSPRR